MDVTTYEWIVGDSEKGRSGFHVKSQHVNLTNGKRAIVRSDLLGRKRIVGNNAI